MNISSDQTGTFSPRQDVAVENFGSIAFTTSTPSNPTRRSGRKSWFDNLGNPGKGTKYEIAIEKKVKRRSAGRRKSEEGEIETLTLTHFTNPPRISFGRAKPGMIKRRSLLIKNPHDHPQDVKVEKFPFKKHFDIDQTKFTVEAEGTLLLTITWSPEEEGNFREMILLQVDGSYRLQAFVFGCVENPPQKKKVKKGLMSRATKKPFSIIQTPSLANIAKSYSPPKARRSGEAHQRQSRGRENKVPAPVKKSQVRNQDVLHDHPKQKQSLVLPTQVVDGCLDSDIKISHITPIKPAEDTIKSAGFVVPKVVKMPGKSVKKLKDDYEEELESLSPLVSKYLDNSDDDVIVVRQTMNSHEDQTNKLNINTPDRIMMNNLNNSKRILSTNQDTPKNITIVQGSEPQKRDLNTSDKVDLVNEITPVKENVQWFDQENRSDALSPNSFLHDSLCSLRGIDTSLFDAGATISRQPAHSTILPTPERMSRANQPMNDFISPNKFLKELNDTQERLELSFQHDPNTIPSPESILNSSIPHAIMVKQLQTVKMSLATQNPSPLFSPMSLGNKRETFVLKSTLTANQSPALRRETFIKERTAITHKTPSSGPRRTTFKRQGNQTAKTKKEDMKSGEVNASISVAKKGNRENLCKEPIFAAGKFKQDRINEDSLDGAIFGSPIPTHITTTSSIHQEAINTPELLVNINTEGKISTGKRLFAQCVDTPTAELLPCRTPNIGTELPSDVGKEKHDRMSRDSLDESISTINSATVTKEKPLNDITPEGRTSTGKQLFTPDNGVSPTQDSIFHSPSALPVDTPMRELFTRRATLTVTKERPSDALLQVTRKHLSSQLNTEDTDITSDVTVNNLSNDSPRLLTVVPEENPERCISILLKNSTTLHSVGLTPTEVSINRTSSFTTTPHELPTSPNPDNSRRSTHVVEKPKVLDLSIVGRKRLFPPLEDPDVEAAIQTTEMAATTHSTNGVSPVTIDHPNQVTLVTKSLTQQANEEISHDASDIAEISVKSKLVEMAKEQQPKADGASVEQTTDKTVTISQERQPYVAFISGSPVNTKAQKSVMTDRGREMVKKRTHSENRAVKEVSNKRLRSTGSVQTGVSGRAQAAPTLSRPTTRARPATKGDTKLGVPLRPANKTKCAVKGVAQTKLILMKRTRPTALPKHPMPFASKNMYYDERWIDKQERGFVHWLNFVLTPAEEYQHNNKRVKVDAGALCVEASRANVKLAPSKEVLSIRAYTARRRLNQLRRSACNLFQTKEIVHVIQKLEAEIESLRLVIRKDKKVHADLGMKQNILDTILSFNPLWLRIGMETVYGEMIPMQNNSDVISMSRFIVTRLLSNPDIASEYCHPTVPHLYRDGYAEAIAQHLLKKFFMLIFFLDQAKSHRLIHHDPCLFCKDSEFKSTKAILIHFSRNYLSGEGDVTKHLGYLGYVVTHQQTSMDEFDYAVTNLATDLRDGVRLTRVLELLTNRWDLSKNLRTPAISRLQKVHNMEVVFKALTTQGVTFDMEKKVTTKDVVDGHREKTLHVLWGLILQYQVGVLLNEDQLREEIDILQRSLHVRNQLAALQRYEQGLSMKRRESAEQDLHMQSDSLLLLLRWCRTVCAFYHIKIENFTVSFGDGRAMCALVHHYHPSLLPWDSIHKKTTLTYQDDLEEELCNRDLDLNSSEVFSPAPFPVAEDPVLFEEFLSNEKANFKLLYEKVSELGGIPLMLRSMDMSNTIPDEKVVVTYICYLCARLLDIRHESRAARVIQLAWRRHYLRRSKKELQMKHDAAVVIQRAVRRLQKARQAVRRDEGAKVIQKYVRMWLARRTVAQLKAADEERCRTTAACVVQAAIRKWLKKRMTTRQLAIIRIQAAWRCHIQRESYKRIKSACIILQKQSRMHSQKSRYLKIRQAVICIQRRYRAHHSMANQRREYLQMRFAAITLQSRYRGLVQRQTFLRQRASAIEIQALVRMWIDRQQYRSLRLATVTIQRRYRANLKAAVVREEFLLQKGAAITIQACFKSHIVRRNIRQLHSAAVIIQSRFKGFQEHKRYLKVKSAIITLQRWKRAITEGKLARSEFQNVKTAVVKIQSAYRGHRARSEFLTQRSAAIAIQVHVRGHQRRIAYRKLKAAAIVLQRRFKASRDGEKVRRHFMIQKGAAMTIQAFYRGHMVRQEVKHLHSAATKIEAAVKAHLQRKKFLRLKTSASIIQRKYQANLEGRKVRKEFMVKKGAVMTIQAHFRGHMVRKNIRHLHTAAVIIQSHFKGFQEYKRYLKVKSATITLQRWKRAITEGKLARSEFQKVKISVVKIQSAYRGHRARSEFLTQRSAVVTIQAHLKGHQRRIAYRKLKTAAIVLQRRFKASRDGEEVRRHFMIQKGAAMTIQAFYRGHMVRQEVKRLHSAATKIEAAVKAHLQRKKFLRLKNSASIIQRKYKANLEGRRVRKEFMVKKGAAMTIQAHFRGHMVRRNIRHLHTAAGIIQSHFKGFQEYKRYLKVKSATITLQRWKRAITQGKLARSEFQKVKISVVKIQSAYRGHRARSTFLALRSAAIVIQAHVRGHQKRIAYRKLKAAAIVLQRRFKASREGEKVRRHFLIQKGAAMMIQAFYRGHMVRQEVKRLHSAATKIEAAVKAHLQRKKFLRLKTSASIIQRKYKANLEGRKVRKEFMVKKGAVMTIQVHFRGHMVRKNIRHLHTAAVIIQSHFKGFQEYKRYLKVKSATITLQRWKRAITQGKLARSEFQKVKISVVKIQSAYRGHRARSTFLALRSAAIVIQAHVRGHQKRIAYRKLKAAAIVLQRRFQASREGEKVRRHFMIQKGAAMTIQAFYRGHIVRQEVKRLHSAATKIEAAVKAHLQRKKFLRLKYSASIIQRKYKANLEGRRVRKEFMVKKGAAMTIQAHFRGHMVRQEVVTVNLAANIIQSKVKGYLQRKKFLKLKGAAIVLQQRFTAYLAGRHLRKEFLVRKGAAMTVQAAFRGYTVRKAMVRYNRAAVVIQSVYRAHRATIMYKQQRSASICVQRWYRNLLSSRLIRAHYLGMRAAAVTIQAWYRCHKAVQILKMDKACVVTSQAVVRGYLQRKRFLRLRRATVVIQRRIVARRQCINMRRAFLIQEGAAMTIQAALRGHLVRQDLRRQHVAAVVIQSMYRTHQAVLSYGKQRLAVTAIQSWYRSCLDTRKVRSEYLTKKHATVVIQKHYRSCQARRAYLCDLSNIILIQALVRGMLQRIAYRRLQWAAIVCQTRYRAMLACHQQQCQFLNLRSAAIVLQSAWRRRTVQTMYNKTRQAVVLVQSHARKIQKRKRFCQLKAVTIQCQRLVCAKRQMQECRRDYLITLGAIITIQAHIRSFLVRKQYHATCKSVISIQAYVRRFLAQRQYRKTYSAVVIIQKRLRACIATKRQRSLFLAQRQAALVIQTVFRGTQARMYVRKVRSAIMIQKTYRMFVARQNFVRQRNAAIVLQSHHRAYLARQEKTRRKLALVSLQRAIKMFLFRQRLRYWIQNRNEAATRIQSCFRSYIARQCVTRTKAAVVVQSIYRMYSQRRQYLCVVKSVLLLQSGLRGTLARRRLQHIRTQHGAATCIQTAYRSFKGRQEDQELRRRRMVYLEKFSGVVSTHLSVIKIQRRYRNYRLLLAAQQRLNTILVIQRWMRAKLARMRFLRFMSAIRVIQTRARQHLRLRQASVIKLQAVVRGWLERQWIVHREQSAIKLQSIWRGRRVRKTHHSKKLENIRKNLKEATKTATEDKKLGNRTESALDYLLKYKQLSQILEALTHLETSTRLSPACCQRMVNVNAVGVIYRLIQSCNRSQPHMEIIRYSINILLNLAKYEKTRAAVYEVEGATECLLELMQVYREKGHIFSCSCTLMGILGMMEDKKQVILTDKKVTSKLLSIYTLTARKHKITETRLIRQAKITAAKSFNATLPILHSQRRQPRIHPDWVLQRNKMRHIEDPLQAIKFVLDNFQLIPK